MIGKERLHIMKKLAAILTALVLAVSAVSIPASAAFYKPSESTTPIKFYVPRVSASEVVKDGKIGENEYTKLNVNTNPYTTSLNLVFGTDYRGLERAENMVKTIEYYFSWDNIHGLNLAVRYKPEKQYQQLDVLKNGKYPQDDFLNNCGIGIHFQDPNLSKDYDLYYAIAKRTDTGEYLQGWWTQLGIGQSYTAEAEKDFVIEYEDDGYITYEWSVPFSAFLKGTPKAGTKFQISIGATAGDSAKADYSTVYGVSFGDFGYLAGSGNNLSHAIGTLTDELSTTDSPFTDVSADDWFGESALFAYSNGLVNGMTETTFEPKTKMSRAMLVTMLWRLDGSPTKTFSGAPTQFVDLKQNWYSIAVKWASKNGIVLGIDDRHFGPDENVTREQIATILERYAKYLGQDTTTDASGLVFADSDAVSGYAKSSMNWMVANGYIQGDVTANGTIVLNPQGEATRAEVVTMFCRFIKSQII